ncbi:ferrochelatase [Micromonospora sp. BRA006-A]|nr:ferrochelatase [Micromonospora sp. BRA006-A]
MSAAATAGPHGGRYTAQLEEVARLVHAAAAPDLEYDLVWQSRSGPPQVPWLEPDVNDHLATLPEQGVTSVVVSPIGFVSDHLEVVWDLDTEALETAKQLGLDFVGPAPRGRPAVRGDGPRAGAGAHRTGRERLRHRLGELPAWDTCPALCCVPRPAGPEPDPTTPLGTTRCLTASRCRAGSPTWTACWCTRGSRCPEPRSSSRNRVPPANRSWC